MNSALNSGITIIVAGVVFVCDTVAQLGKIEIAAAAVGRDVPL